MFQWEIKQPHNQPKGSSMHGTAKLKKIKVRWIIYLNNLDEVIWTSKMW